MNTLRDALAAYLRAQCRMLDKWADGDDGVKRGLWRDLHACEEAGRAALHLHPASISHGDHTAALLPYHRDCPVCRERKVSGTPQDSIASK